MNINKIFIIKISFIIFSIYIPRCNVSLPPQGFRPDMLIENYTTTNFKNGSIEWTLKADRASYYFEEKRSIAERIDLNYFKDDKQTANVKAERAVINTETMDIELSGNVDMRSVTGNRLLTSKIIWNNKKAFLDTDEDIIILRNNGDVIEGTGLRADYNLESYEIKKNTRAITKNIGNTFNNNKK